MNKSLASRTSIFLFTIAVVAFAYTFGVMAWLLFAAESDTIAETFRSAALAFKSFAICLLIVMIVVPSALIAQFYSESRAQAN